MKRSGIPRLIVAATVFQAAACAIWTTETAVQVVVPPLPDYWHTVPGQIEYLIRWFDVNGEQQERFVPAGTSRVGISVPKLRGIPVLLIPRIGRFTLLPAGALFPDHLGAADTMHLSWQGGAATVVLWRIAAVTGRPSRYHGGRLYRELDARTAGNPWSADLDAITGQLIAGNFRSTSIRPRPRFPVRAEVPHGQWLSEAPLIAPVATDDERGMIELELEVGTHRYFHCATGAVLTVAVNEKGMAVFTVRP
jgi:hypothetical protein